MPVLGEDNESNAPIVGASPQEIADYLQELEPTKNGSSPGMIGFCMECKNPQPDAYMENSPFYRQGGVTPCKYCGGVTVIMREDMVNNPGVQARLDASRGIGQTIQPGSPN